MNPYVATTSLPPTLRASSDIWWNSYVGLPYKWNGTSRAGVSCWGLVCLIYEEVFGIHLERHDEIEAGVAAGDPAAVAEYAIAGQEIPLNQVASGDVLQLKGISGRHITDGHCGIVTRPGSVLHIENGAGSHVIRYEGNPAFRNRVLKAFRYEPARTS